MLDVHVTPPIRDSALVRAVDEEKKNPVFTSLPPDNEISTQINSVIAWRKIITSPTVDLFGARRAELPRVNNEWAIRLGNALLNAIPERFRGIFLDNSEGILNCELNFYLGAEPGAWQEVFRLWGVVDIGDHGICTGKHLLTLRPRGCYSSETKPCAQFAIDTGNDSPFHRDSLFARRGAFKDDEKTPRHARTRPRQGA